MIRTFQNDNILYVPAQEVALLDRRIRHHVKDYILDQVGRIVEGAADLIIGEIGDSIRSQIRNSHIP
jgi:hypothetical protein